MNTLTIGDLTADYRQVVAACLKSYLPVDTLLANGNYLLTDISTYIIYVLKLCIYNNS